jgi:PPOX class probable F420-dependent enzyme
VSGQIRVASRASLLTPSLRTVGEREGWRRWTAASGRERDGRPARDLVFYRVDATEARERLAAARVARLATVDPMGRPHLIPICFAVDGETIYNAVDHKPKRTSHLRRLRNVAANPRVAVLADHYEDDDWGALWWVRADGAGRILDAGSAEARRAVELLIGRYGPYRRSPPPGPVLAVDVERWSGWRASG